MLLSNIVTGKKLKEVQLQTLKDISDVISKTAGPFGSSTMILHDDSLTEYSKDGHKVLSNIQYHKPIERAVHDELLNITEYVVRNVGDGTTSAVQLSYIIFRELYKYMSGEGAEYPTHMIIDALENVVSQIKKRIKLSSRDLTSDDVYKICMISTNGNIQISEDISSIYKKMGNDVFIQVNTSNSDNTVLKTYDGIFLDKGYPSAAFINTDKGTTDIRNPRIYYFEDVVDTPDMMNMFMRIFKDNIYDHYAAGKPENYIPTIILAPSVSQDLKGELANIEAIFYSFDKANASTQKPPFCIVTGINTNDNIDDIVMLCGCPRIKKFINPDVEAKAIEEGNAPSPDTVTNFYGTADQVIIDSSTTKFINPQYLFDDTAEIAEDGSRPHSKVYEGLVNHLKAELKLAEESREDLTLIVNLKRRLNHLETNFVEYFVGGVAASDRDNVKDLVEDAVLNCRAAAVNGVGFGANFEGLLASSKVHRGMDLTNSTALERVISHTIAVSYYELVLNLYSTAYPEKEAKEKIEADVKNGYPTNLRTGESDGSVLCALNEDPVILDAVTRIVSVMVLSNQALVQEPIRNAYIDVDKD